MSKKDIAIRTTASTKDNSLSALQKFEEEKDMTKKDCPKKWPNHNPRYLLGSVGACAEGITAVREKILHMMEPFWEWTKEIRVMARISRIGQTMKTSSVRYITPGISCEDNHIRVLSDKMRLRKIHNQTAGEREQKRKKEKEEARGALIAAAAYDAQFIA